MIRAIFFLLCIVGSVISLRGELAGDPTDPDFIRATMQIATPGPAIYQVTGHTFIRMECPAANLDYCFTFENESAGRFGQLFKNVYGRFISVPTAEYIKPFTDKGREIINLPLNLRPLEKQRLWQVLDSLTLTGGHRFNIRKESCSGYILSAIDIALSPASIGVIGSDLIGRENGFVIKNVALGESPWRASLIMMALGDDADATERMYNHAVPIVIAAEWMNFYIESAGEPPRRLFNAPDKEVRLKSSDEAQGITPAIVASGFLLLSVISFAVRLRRGANRFSNAVQVVYAILLTAGGALLFIICSIPSAIGGLNNLNFLLLNPLPLLLLPCGGRRRWQIAVRYTLFAAWTLTVVAPLLTWSVPPAMSILALGAIFATLPPRERRSARES